MKKVKTAFFGSSRYSIPYLESLYKSELIDLSLVVSQPDKPVGRGLEMRASPVKQWAKQKEIMVLTPSPLDNSLFLGALTSLPLKLGIISYYGLIIPKSIIDLFPLGILNIHHSLLPKHRGTNPIPWTILSGEEKTGTTIIKIAEKFDEGEIVAFDEEIIQPSDTAETLRGRLDSKAVILLEKILPRFLEGKLNLRKQNKAEGSYEPKLTKELGQIDFSKSGEEIERAIRAFTPWPGAWTTLGGLTSSSELNMDNSKGKNKRVKLLKAHLDENKKLVIDELQVEGKNPLSFEVFKNGYPRSESQKADSGSSPQ